MTPPIIRRTLTHLTGARGGWPKAFEFSFSTWYLGHCSKQKPLFYQYSLSFAVVAGGLLYILCGSAELSPPSLSS